MLKAGLRCLARHSSSHGVAEWTLGVARVRLDAVYRFRYRAVRSRFVGSIVVSVICRKPGAHRCHNHRGKTGSDGARHSQIAANDAGYEMLACRSEVGYEKDDAVRRHSPILASKMYAVLLWREFARVRRWATELL
jgi:hypothetical protein